MRTFVALATGLAACGLAATISAQDQAPPRPPYDGIQAGYHAFQLGEERRRANIAYQLYLNDQLKYWSGIPTSRGETIYFSAGAPATFAAGFYGNAVPVTPSANLDYTYAYGRSAGRGWAGAAARQGAWFGPQTVFEPWPYVPGDIWGYMYYSPMRQPIGQQQVQTGANRWESHPVYDPPLPNFRPLPPVNSPLLDGTPYETPSAPTDAPRVSPPPPVADPSVFDAPKTPDSELPPAPPPKPRRPREY